MVLPELHPRVRPAAQAVDLAQRRPVGEGRQHRARREGDSDPGDVIRRGAGIGEHAANRALEAADVVARILERPVRLELDVVVRSGEPRADDAVPIGLDARSDLAPVGAVDEKGACRFGAEVDPEREAHVGCP